MERPAVYITPYSQLKWHNLSEWVQAAEILQKRRCGWRTSTQRMCHVSVLPDCLIWECSCKITLQRALGLLSDNSSDFRQPPRGQRLMAPHTPLIVSIKNRLQQIEREEDMISIPDGHNSKNRAGMVDKDI